jgi:hypothetical protein
VSSRKKQAALSKLHGVGRLPFEGRKVAMRYALLKHEGQADKPLPRRPMQIVVHTPLQATSARRRDRLIDAKHDVVIVSRHPERFAIAATKGAKLVPGSIDEEARVDRARKDCFGRLGTVAGARARSAPTDS